MTGPMYINYSFRNSDNFINNGWRDIFTFPSKMACVKCDHSFFVQGLKNLYKIVPNGEI